MVTFLSNSLSFFTWLVSFFFRHDQSQTNFFRCRSLILGAWVLGHMETKKVMAPIRFSHFTRCAMLLHEPLHWYLPGRKESNHWMLSSMRCLACFDCRTRFWIVRETGLGLRSSRRRGVSPCLFTRVDILLILLESTRFSRLWWTVVGSCCDYHYQHFYSGILWFMNLCIITLLSIINADSAIIFHIYCVLLSTPLLCRSCSPRGLPAG